MKTVGEVLERCDVAPRHRHYVLSLIAAVLLSLLLPMFAALMLVLATFPIILGIGLVFFVLLPENVWAYALATLVSLTVSGFLLGHSIPRASRVVSSYLSMIGSLFSISEYYFNRNSQSYVLYLRSFRSDAKRYRTSNYKASLFLLGEWIAAYRAIRTFVSRITWNSESVLFSVLKTWAPIIAIGSPSDKFPASGSIRVYVRGDGWQETVATLAESAKTIVFYYDDSKGLEWELQHIKEKGYVGKSIFLCVDNSGEPSPTDVQKLSHLLYPGLELEYIDADRERLNRFIILEDTDGAPKILNGRQGFRGRTNLLYCAKKVLQNLKERIARKHMNLPAILETILIRYGMCHLSSAVLVYFAPAGEFFGVAVISAIMFCSTIYAEIKTSLAARKVMLDRQ